MKKIIALLAFALVTALVGCGSGGGGSKFVLNRGDNGQSLIDNGFKDVKDSYDKINEVFINNGLENDKNGTTRANKFKEYISDDYTGSNAYSTDVSTKDKLVNRLQSLIKNKNFEGLEIIPLKIIDGPVADKEVTEKTKLYVAKFVHDKTTYTNKEYVFNSVKWKNEGTAEEPDWKIVSGFDDLGKSVSELTK
jgi:hypothetical protein